VPPDPPDPYLRLHAVRVFVRDQERSLRFYLDQLGFKLAFDAQLESGPRWLAVTPPDGGAVISLVAPSPRSPEYKLIGRATQVVFVTDDVLGRYREWRKRGVRFRYTPRLQRVRYARGDKIQRPGTGEAAWGGAFTRFADVDGNTFTLASFDEESRAVEAQRRAATEKLESDRRAAHELEIARKVQARLFPQTLPACKTLEYAGACLPAQHVGGDYYDFLNLGQDRLGLVIGDVAGKGIAAALVMANLQANLRSHCATALERPERFLQAVNQLFCENTIDSAYATLLFAEYDDRAQRLRFANCGHLHGLLLRKDGTLDRLETTATVLGLFQDWDCTIGERQLARGDVFVLYTDGVTESFDAKGDEFGEERLIESLLRRRGLSSQAAIEAIVEDVRAFSPLEQHDDITLIVAKCKGS
jgi:serine phosphatase RsbU (regulator of sigma subunit)/catechol 2,3-dioxygenase-like lactoylglutathione lyase family enzyme